jgi:hypothetical protein
MVVQEVERVQVPDRALGQAQVREQEPVQGQAPALEVVRARVQTHLAQELAVEQVLAVAEPKIQCLNSLTLREGLYRS